MSDTFPEGTLAFPLAYVKRASAERQAAAWQEIMGDSMTVTVGEKVNGRYPLIFTNAAHLEVWLNERHDGCER